MRPGRIKPIYAYAVADKNGNILQLAKTRDVAMEELTTMLAETDLSDLRIVDVHVRPTTARDIGRFK